MEKLYQEEFPQQSDLDFKLSRSGASDEEYKRALNVYKTLKCKIFLDYRLTY